MSVRGARGLCIKHYRRLLNAGRSCAVDQCARPVEVAGLCKAHHHRKARGTLDRVDPSPQERFESTVTVRPDGCWAWGTVDRYGYGYIRIDGQRISAHRYSYNLYVGPIEPDLTLDHACHTASRDTCPGGTECTHRRCVNPAHLEPMSASENVLVGNAPPAINARKVACIHGHPFDSANTLISAKGYRRCLACRRMRNERRRVRA